MSDQQIAQRNQILAAVLAFVSVCIVLLVAYSLIYSGKIYAGVTINGVAVGGMSVADAQSKVATAATNYNTALIPVQYGSTTVRIPISQLAVKYQPDAAEAAVQYGRSGSLIQQAHARLRAFFGRPTVFTGYKYDDARLQPFLNQIDDDATAPVANASLRFDGGTVSVVDASPGKRLDRGSLTLALKHQLDVMGTGTVDAPIYDMPPAISSASLSAAKAQADRFVSEPITLKVSGQTKTVDVATITGWIRVDEAQAQTDISTADISHFYHTDAPVSVALKVDKTKVAGFVAELANSVDQQGQNAALTIQDGKAVVFQPSRNGIALDQAAATDAIADVVDHAPGNRTVTLATKISKPTVNEENLNNLGIKELISEGQTFFPGSPSTRLTNIRVGAAKYNGVLVAPGDTFSFGQILGDVGPAQGYVPELVILGDHEEKQYGGGLCQVASTAYRAALLAGLPIVERHNHSFAVSYYTAPFGVPGVDATIYYPQVDFKFKNDTPGYILIQTIMQGTTLKFDFYGTKTKSGVIRGPQFISGTTDSTQPSHTIFWRDIVDLNGNVMKTDTIETWYKSSKDFPINTQFN
jgi:vancomycin resistance protein YoaR